MKFGVAVPSTVYSLQLQHFSFYRLASEGPKCNRSIRCSHTTCCVSRIWTSSPRGTVPSWRKATAIALPARSGSIPVANIFLENKIYIFWLSLSSSWCYKCLSYWYSNALFLFLHVCEAEELFIHSAARCKITNQDIGKNEAEHSWTRRTLFWIQIQFQINC